MSLHDLSSNDRCNVEIFFRKEDAAETLRARAYNTKMLKQKLHRYQLFFEPGKGRVWTFIQKRLNLTWLDRHNSYIHAGISSIIVLLSNAPF